MSYWSRGFIDQWGILKDFTQIRFLSLIGWEKSIRQNSIIIWISDTIWFGLINLFLSLFAENWWCPYHRYQQTKNPRDQPKPTQTIPNPTFQIKSNKLFLPHQTYKDTTTSLQKLMSFCYQKTKPNGHRTLSFEAGNGNWWGPRNHERK